MPTIYGTVDLLALVRSTLSTHLNALKTAMTSGAISPKFEAVYDDHWGTLGLVFPSVSIGVDLTQVPYVGSSSGTHRTDWNVQVGLRIMIGNTNIFRDEVKIHRLAQSVINYLEERRILYDSASPAERVVWTGASELRPIRVFEDTRTIGAELILMCRAHSTYTRV